MSSLDIEPTAAAIDAMAEQMRDSAEELTRIAARIRSAEELTPVGDALSCVANLIPNLRMDLLIQRPLRALGVK